jgi:GNAT superfamily N-acetyltransferase
VTLPDDLRARPLAAGDGPALAALVTACDQTYVDWAPAGWTAPEVAPDWAARFAEPDRWSCCVVDAPPAGAFVGFVSFRPARASETPGRADGAVLPGVAHVGALFVHPSRWREGVGAWLLRRAEREARARGYTAAQLWTPQGAPAERFYAASGWRRDGRVAWHDWMGLTVVGYAKPL